jgi:NAD(P)-dependent dehydrogenase (short-subunit alcohol dehydrogenase family)
MEGCMEFGNEVVMLTGAGGRLGRPCAVAFAAEGARLLLTDVAVPALEETARLAQAGGATVMAMPADVTRRADVEAALAEGRRRLGPVDVLVNFAGYVPVSPVLEVSEEEWDRVFAVNVKGTMLCCQAVGRQMVERVAAGRIVNISSGASTSARAGAAHYCGSKAAINMLTEVLATELGPHGIRVNAVAPGLVMDTVIRKGSPVPHPYVRDMLAATPLGRTGAPEDIAQAVLFLASPRSGWITGEVLFATGGAHCGRTHMALAAGRLEPAPARTVAER